MQWQVGKVKITRILESEMVGGAVSILPDLTPKNLLEHHWLKPHYITDQGEVKWSIQALVLETETDVVVVDTCIGNDKDRASPAFNMLNSSFLQQLESFGYSRESVTTVLCTHLHVDHVGWNTMWLDNKWQPTFPNARYLIAREEYLHCQPYLDKVDFLIDSIKPIFDADLVDLIESHHEVCNEIKLFPTPGHTKGHVSIRILSEGDEAIITGDVMHTPCQMINPKWGCSLDYQSDVAAETRAKMIEDNQNRPVLVFGTHFPTPVAGYIKNDNGNVRFDIEEGNVSV